MKYTVHGYEVVRVKVVGIEAESQEQAIEKYKALTRTSLARTFGRPMGWPSGLSETEYAGETAYYLVDEEGEEDFEHSHWHRGVFDPDASPHRRLDPAEEAAANR